MQQPLQRFGKVNAVEAERTQEFLEPSALLASQQTSQAEQAEHEEEKLDRKIEAILQQVNALKLRFDRQEAPARQMSNQQSNDTAQRNQNSAQHSQSAEAASSRVVVLVCWNCDEEGHRFMDCTKPQAILFCYRCGQKGFSLRSCRSCQQRAGNGSAGIQ